MPALFILLLVLVGYAMSEGEFVRGLEFLFNPDFTKIKPDAVLVALGHAFFTLSLGMGAIMVYGSYLPKETSIAKASITIALMDTVVALLAGMAIFPIVFANGLETGSGPGLIFQTLPIAFGHMPGGAFFGTLFFMLLVFAAWTSGISLIEPAVAWLVENRGHTRIYAAVVVGMTTWLLGVLTVLSFNILSDFKPINIGPFTGKTIFDILDYLTANVMLPLGGLFIALFAGWIMHRKMTEDELVLSANSYQVWHFVIRYISPLAILIVFLKAVELI
jgi:NSS family neurotransmitter:Na+ symporter